MSEPDGRHDLDTDDAPPAAQVAPSAAAAAASALLEEVARARGLPVRRLDPETVLCESGGRRMLFHGLAGGATSRLAQVLCGNDAWLRAHLARHGIPVVPTRLVPADDPLFAEEAARRLGFPVRLRLADPADEAPARTADDVASFHESWRALTATLDDPRARLILEHRPAGQVAEVAVVGRRAVATSAGLPSHLAERVRRLAIDAVAALPPVSCGLVRVIADGAGGLVDTVSVGTTGDLGEDAGRQVVAAFLDTVDGASATPGRAPTS